MAPGDLADGHGGHDGHDGHDGHQHHEPAGARTVRHPPWRTVRVRAGPGRLAAKRANAAPIRPAPLT
ncbi:hypothetical protein OHA44_25325 [Streptomyces sp. NBC_00144]|uniref:hypothetical protein n=1 Tax=Streptomyces sp. NBC_00144 TaxID=2975665 RepID=UPI003254E974